MARSYDRRKGSPGPLIGVRGDDRSLVGRVTPGDHVEVSREIERIWDWLHKLNRKSARALRIAQNIDFSSLQIQIDDINTLIEANPNVPPIQQFDLLTTFHTTSYTLVDASASVWEPIVLNDHAALLNAGYALEVRVQYYREWSGYIGVGGNVVQLWDMNAGNVVGATLDSGWVAISVTPDGDGVGRTAMSMNLGSYGTAADIFSGSAYFRYVPSGVDNTSIVYANDLRASFSPVYIADQTLASNDTYVMAEPASANITLTLPPIASFPGRMILVKKTNANAYTVTVDADGSETIDGAANYVLATQYEFVHIACDDVEWRIIGAYAGSPL